MRVLRSSDSSLVHLTTDTAHFINADLANFRPITLRSRNSIKKDVQTTE